MHFSDIQISNYKSYQDSTRLNLATGINIIVGKNNAGKTALIDALSLKFDANPHRTIETMPTHLRWPKQESVVTFTLTLTIDELTDLLIHTPGDPGFSLPLPMQDSVVWVQLKLGNYIETAAEKFQGWFFSHDTFTFRIRREAVGPFPAANWHVGDDTYVHPQFDRGSRDQSATYSMFKVDPVERTFLFKGFTTVHGGADDFILRICRSLDRYVYRFNAERIPSFPCERSMERALNSDASNLAAVLNLLQGTPSQFSEFSRLVREILPQIHQIGTQLVDNNKVAVIVWTDEKAVFTEHLAFNLNECGSGVGQVLAIMYVVVAASEPQVIILDEPQGFLHPGAVRKLVDVLRHYTKDKHQIIIATHSPTVISAADPVSVTMIEQSEAESVFKNIEIAKVADQQMYLDSVGARLSDVFGYDRVLWVEGQTEEICFPLILRKLTKQPLMGTAILRVQHTGDFDRKKDAKNVVRIYDRLTHLDGGLVPPVVGFVLDVDARSEEKQKELKHLSGNRFYFLGKRLFENYLLNPAAIAAVINRFDDTRNDELNELDVLAWIEENKTNPEYYKPLKCPSEVWSDEVDGALFLRHAFRDLSESRVQFEKIAHSPLLTDYILQNSPEDLKDLTQLLCTILVSNQKKST